MRCNKCTRNDGTFILPTAVIYTGFSVGIEFRGCGRAMPSRFGKQGIAVVAALAILGGGEAQAQSPSPAPDYSKPSTWLCLPDRSDVCTRPLPTTALGPSGYGSNGQSAVAKDPPVDCFYVYPTVSRDDAPNSDLTVNEEVGITQTQFARFSSVCRTFAPIYRQMTVSSIAVYVIGGDLHQSAELAYSDVLAAWRIYLSKYNQGRPFVLIGHSQGSLMLQQLIQREIDGKPIARRMLRAIIPGYDVIVPQGKLVGGTFKSIPLCSSDAETGCVMAWTSYREGSVPPEGAMFGWTNQPGMTVGCTNPAHPGSTAWQPLDSYWYTHSAAEVSGGPIQWSTEGPPPTPYVRTEGLVSARCVNSGQRGHLSIRTNYRLGEKWTNRIGGEVGLFGFFLPGWGMHLADIEEAQGDLIREISGLANER